jgi:hypothetical protein
MCGYVEPDPVSNRTCLGLLFLKILKKIGNWGVLKCGEPGGPPDNLKVLANKTNP